MIYNYIAVEVKQFAIVSAVLYFSEKRHLSQTHTTSLSVKQLVHSRSGVCDKCHFNKYEFLKKKTRFFSLLAHVFDTRVLCALSTRISKSYSFISIQRVL